VSRVVVVGGGPAGLAAAIELRRRGVAEVVVLERDAGAGGVPRHCDHTGFGLRDLHRVLGGPAYAARYVTQADRTGVEIRTATTATGWAGATSLDVTSPRGVERLDADAVVLATGCRERPRSARLVAGTRPLGVFTTGALQQLVHLQHARPGRRAVVVGAEHVSFSAVMTLAEAGCRTVAMVTEHRRHQTYAPLKLLAARGVPIVTGRRVASIRGRERVEAVELDDGRALDCDTVVFTGDWIPDHELARRGGLAIDAGTRGPAIDQQGRTSVPGVFATGNLVHAAETADVAALGSRDVARHVVRFLERPTWASDVLASVVESPLRWVWPTALDPHEAPPARFILRVDSFVDAATLTVTQGSVTLWEKRLWRLVPNRSIVVTGGWTAAAMPNRPLCWSLGR
jgi:NADPH-dependent 2,4-dienoyl-CoA reductase/sulfur reductase-like enzyme